MSDSAGPSSSTDTAADSGDVAVEAAKLLGTGRRHLLVGDAPAAVQVLQESCGLLAAKYGEMGDELGEVYFHYGSALLELGRMESGVLGNALEGVPDATTDDSDEDDGDEKVESTKKLPDEGAGPSSADDGEEKGEASEAKTDEVAAEDAAEDTAEDTAEEGDVAKGEKEGEDADDVGNFQLCWEILELARVIFGRKDDKEFQLKVSQVHLKLGELGLETEQYQQSIDDFNLCLTIQKKLLESESRLLAETHYNLGLAYGFDKRFTEAIEHYEGAKKVIETRIAKLEKNIKANEDQGKGKEKADAEDPVVKAQKEIAELKDLLPEVTAKLEEHKEMKKSAEDAASQAIAAAAAEFGLGAGLSGEGSSSSAFDKPTSSEPAKPIQARKADGTAAAPSNISHLVRRKRKPDEEGQDSKEDTVEAKRSKPDEAGDAPATKANGHAATVNGHASQNGDAAPNKQEATTKTVGKEVNGDEAPATAMETT